MFFAIFCDLPLNSRLIAPISTRSTSKKGKWLGTLFETLFEI